MIRTPKQNLRKPKTKIILPNRLKYRKVLLLRKDIEIEDLVNMAKPREEELLEIIEPLIPEPIKGDDGLTPTDEELIALIEPRIPAPIKGDKGENGKDGKTPTKTEIKGIIKEVLPEEKIVEKVLKKIPKPKDGKKGDKGEDGKSFRFADLTAYEKQILTGPQGSNGVGVPRGGTTGQKLIKSSSRDFDTEWTDDSGGGAVDSVNGQTGVVVLDQDDIGDGTTYKQYSQTEKTKLAGIETGAEVNTIDTVSDTSEIDLAITARDLTATIRAGSIDESKLDTSVNASLDLADTALQSSAIGVSVQSYSSVLQNTTASFTTTDETKLDNITVTQAVNLDTMESDIAALANGMVYKGNWDASAGTFPGAGSAQTGWFYTVSVGGTVDSVVFNVGDRLIATTDNASTTTYSGNWTQLDATDAVTSVFGRTGNVVATNGDYTASNITNVPAGNIAATDVQAALNELDTEKVPYTGATADLNLGTHDIVTDTARASTSAGLLVESANGTDVGLLGAGNTANITWYGNHNFDTATQDTIAGFTGAGKTLGSLATATYPSLTELSYVKGVTSAIQTQLNTKLDGSLTATRVPYASDANTLTDEAGFVYDATNNFLGVNKATPLATVHGGANTITTATPTGFSASAVFGVPGYAFGSGNKNYSVYKRIGAIYSSALTGTLTQPVLSDGDLSSYSVTPNYSGSGYAATGSQQDLEIYAVFPDNTISANAATANFTDNGSDPYSLQHQFSVNQGQPTSVLIVNLTTNEYKVFGTTSSPIEDDHSGWSSMPHGLSTVSSYAVDVSVAGDSAASLWVFRNTSTTKYTTSTIQIARDSADWTAGSPTVTPTSGPGFSGHFDGTVKMGSTTNSAFGIFTQAGAPVPFQGATEIATALEAYGWISNSANLSTSRLSGQVPPANGGTGLINFGGTGRIPFATGAGAGLTTVSTILIADSNRLGIGVASPVAIGHFVGTGYPQGRWGYDLTNYFNIAVSSVGAVVLTAAGSLPTVTFANDINVPDEVYGAGWNGSLEVPTKNAVYDKIETLSTSETAFDPNAANRTGEWVYYVWDLTSGTTNSSVTVTSYLGYSLLTATGANPGISTRLPRMLGAGVADPTWDTIKRIVLSGSISMPSDSGIRGSVGLFESAATGGATNTSNTASIRMLFETNNAVYAVNASGAANTNTTLDTTNDGPNYVHHYCMDIDLVTNSIKYYLDGALAATHTTNIPTGAGTPDLFISFENSGNIGAVSPVSIAYQM